ncbi:hypothetical protein RDWZM_008693 [Blomia tropicalis]|uniref:Uncharacterized protein n=1 Tax=Blomia tropicalis TaxID=40697 RepID=A0A9Q0RKB9_BLOTA|nr:Intraflagellar transport protein 27 [Blomia tropicalis]KAJ6217536.1 hypothetical protein RDWZM_008693 [Blomia tropicalis]
MNQEPIQVRCILLGAAASGKSTFLSKLNNDNLNRNYSMTTRPVTRTKTYVANNNRPAIQVVFIDCPGREELYGKLVNDIVRRIGSKSIIIAMFDVTNRTSLSSLETIINTIGKGDGNKTLELNGILVANKIDLIDKRIVTSNEGQLKSKMFKLRYMECSSLDDLTVQEFDQLLNDIVHNIDRTEQTNGLNVPSTRSNETNGEIN